MILKNAFQIKESESQISKKSAEIKLIKSKKFKKQILKTKKLNPSKLG
jgi:hypothetical protein